MRRRAEPGQADRFSGHSGRGEATEVATGRRPGATGTELLARASAGGGPGAGPSGRAAPESPSGAEVTAEIPVVQGAGRRRAPVELADGTLWYPGVSRRLPAPFGLRLVVWLLLFTLLVGLAGLEVERIHPSWLAFLRRTTPVAAASGSGRRAAPAGTSGTQAARMRLATETSTGSTYDVPARSYSIVLAFSQPCWTKVASPAGSASYLVEQTLSAADSPKVIPVTGSASVDLAAQATSITIKAGQRTLGVIDQPAVAKTYTFEPAR